MELEKFSQIDLENLSVNKIVEIFMQEEREFNNTIVKIGFTGQSGAGKSSLINAIIGAKVAKVGSTETTEKSDSYIYNGLELYDLPGCGTQSFPVETYIEDLNLKQLDCFIVVTAQRIYENDVYLYNELTKMGISCFFVRTHIDKAIEDEDYDNGLSEEETLQKVRKDISSKIDIDIDKVYLVSSRKPLSYDLPSLLRDITLSLKDIKRMRFLADSAVISKEILEAKEEVAKKIITWHAIVAAANGINPIPGTDIIGDVTILKNMVDKVNKIFHLDEESLKYLETKFPKLKQSTDFQIHKQATLQRLAKYAAKESIIKILQELIVKNTSKEVAKRFGKYIPYIGQAVAAGVSYKLMASFGEEYYIEAKENLENIFNDIQNSITK